MKIKFKVGTKVRYIKKCSDHNYISDRLKLKEIYTIGSVDPFNHQGPMVWLKEMKWWVHESCVIFPEELSQADEKYAGVIIKIRELNERFKNRKGEYV